MITPKRPKPIVVTIPDLPGVPHKYRGQPYTVSRLLGDGDSNPKLAKSEASGEYKTWGLALAPAQSSGYQMCASSTAGCRTACLYYQGQARVFPSIPAARLAKTVAFAEHRNWFLRTLSFELAAISKRAAKQAVWTPAVRLNLTSDIMWELAQFGEVFGENPAIQFYDYTKHYLRMLDFLDGHLPGNYHLTFSRSEDNGHRCPEILRKGGTVAIVFRHKNIPEYHEGFPVAIGDDTDLRFLDPKGHWVGLYAKGTAKEDASGFIVDSSNRLIPLPTVAE